MERSTTAAFSVKQVVNVAFQALAEPAQRLKRDVLLTILDAVQGGDGDA